MGALIFVSSLKCPSRAPPSGALCPCMAHWCSGAGGAPLTGRWDFPSQLCFCRFTLTDCSSVVTSCSRQTCGEGPFQDTSSPVNFCRFTPVHGKRCLTPRARNAGCSATAHFLPLLSFGGPLFRLLFSGCYRQGSGTVSVSVLHVPGSYPIL